MTEHPPRARLAGVEVGGSAPVRIMGVLNVSPESFYPGSVRRDPESLRDQALRFVAEGADFLDIGAMSTAPYLETEVSEDEESRRLIEAVETVVAAVTVPISVDTSRVKIARAALAAGASILNDVRGLRAAGMADVAAAASGVVVMASPGPSSPSESAATASPVGIVTADLKEALGRARAGGVQAERVVIDPGVGFYTRTRWTASEFNAALLRGLDSFRSFGHPLLVGVSRKAFIGHLTGRTDPAERLAGSLAAAAIAVWNGAAVVRTHDVAATADAVRVARGLMGAA